MVQLTPSKQVNSKPVNKITLALDWELFNIHSSGYSQACGKRIAGSEAETSGHILNPVFSALPLLPLLFGAGFHPSFRLSQYRHAGPGVLESG